MAELMRARIKRLARKTICFAKSIEPHDIVIGLFVNCYEFGIRWDSRKSRSTTPPSILLKAPASQHSLDTTTRRGTFVIARVWLYQVLFLDHYRHHRPFAQIKEFIAEARWRSAACIARRLQINLGNDDSAANPDALYMVHTSAGNFDTAGQTVADHTSSSYYRDDESMSGDNSYDDDDGGGGDASRQRQRVRSTVCRSQGEGQKKFS